MAKKKQSESVATKFTMVLRPRTPATGKEKVKEKARGKLPVKVDDKAKGKKTVVSGKIKNGNAAKIGNDAKTKLSADGGNTKVAGSRVKKLKAVMDKGAETGSTRVRRFNSAKKGDQSGKKDFKKESAEAKTKKLKKKKIVKKEASLTIRSPNPKKNISVKKEASPAIRSPKPKKNLPAEASKRITRKGGMSEDPMSKERANDTIAKKIRTVQWLKNQETGTNENNEFIKRKKANIVVTDSVFPAEIIMEILSWLPVKFFGTPMVVCKQWYALIQDRHFIEKHMRRNFSFIESNVRQGYTKVYSRDGLRLEMNTSTQKYRIRNPDTKKFLELPDPHKGSYHILFAYVPLTLNYKIVSIYIDKNNIECCEILSVGNDELSWRLLKMPTEDYLERNRKIFLMKLIGDVVHCVRVIASGDDMVEEVISLDLGTEQFTVTNLPKGQYKSWEKVWLIDFKGKPALVDIVGAELCVLVLENYKKQKWAKKESLFPLEFMKKLEVEHGRIFPYFVDRFETLWFWAKEARKPISYDIKTKRIFSKRVYWHSLVRLEGMQPE